MATALTRARSGFERYAWTIFVLLGALLLLLGVGDPSGANTSLQRENALNEMLIGLFGVAIAVYGLARFLVAMPAGLPRSSTTAGRGASSSRCPPTAASATG